MTVFLLMQVVDMSQAAQVTVKVRSSQYFCNGYMLLSTSYPSGVTKAIIIRAAQRGTLQGLIIELVVLLFHYCCH